MKSKVIILAFGLIASAASARKVVSFSGSWEFRPEKSKNVGMMAQMKITETIAQSASALDIVDRSGEGNENKIHYDLSGKAVSNQAPMGGPSETASKWDKGKLITTWTSESAVAGGPKVVRTETRSLSAEGNTMTVESVRGSNATVVIVFERK